MFTAFLLCITYRTYCSRSKWTRNVTEAIQQNYTVSKNDTDVAHYNFNAHQPILVIFGRDVAERVCYQMVIFIPPLQINVSALPGKHEPQNCLFSHVLYRVLITTLLLEHAVNFVFFSDEKVFTVVNLQNDRDYAPSSAKKRDIAPERLLRCRPAWVKRHNFWGSCFPS